MQGAVKIEALKTQALSKTSLPINMQDPLFTWPGTDDMQKEYDSSCKRHGCVMVLFGRPSFGKTSSLRYLHNIPSRVLHVTPPTTCVSADDWLKNVVEICDLPEGCRVGEELAAVISGLDNLSPTLRKAKRAQDFVRHSSVEIQAGCNETMEPARDAFKGVQEFVKQQGGKISNVIGKALRFTGRNKAAATENCPQRPTDAGLEAVETETSSSFPDEIPDTTESLGEQEKKGWPLLILEEMNYKFKEDSALASALGQLMQRAHECKFLVAITSTSLVASYCMCALNGGIKVRPMMKAQRDESESFIADPRLTDSDKALVGSFRRPPQFTLKEIECNDEARKGFLNGYKAMFHESSTADVYSFSFVEDEALAPMIQRFDSFIDSHI